MIPFIALILINWAAHFIPFERAALSLDDLCRMISSEWSLRFFLTEMRSSLDYPLIIFHNLIVMTAGNSPFLRVLYVFLSSSLVTVALYLLLKEILEDPKTAFLGALFYNLLPNKLTLYHTLEYTYINLALALYLLSFFLFILFLKKERPSLLWGAAACYSVAVFWYLLGIFLPAVLLVYALLFYPRKAWSVWVFLIPFSAYLVWRSNLLGFAYWELKPYKIRIDQTAANLFKMVPDLYLGRQMAKGILYGLYRFLTFPLPWGSLWVAMDLGVGVGLWRWLGPRPIPPIRSKVAALALLSFIPLLAPPLLTWGVMDRHTCLSSVPFVILLLWGISRWKLFQRVILIGLLGLGLVISQGTSWNQVVACRINRAIAETLQERREEVLAADRVLIDQYSFSRRIPYTWVKDPNNQMDTYWGVQGLLGRGNPYLVHWVLGEGRAVIVVRSPLRVEGKEFRFQVYNPNTYRLEETAVPAQGSALIDYEAVYRGGFRDGNRAGRPR